MMNDCNNKPVLKKVKCTHHICFEGFFLRDGAWAGYDAHGRAVATSTWTKDGKIRVYRRQDDATWQGDWIPEDEFKAEFPEYKN